MTYIAKLNDTATDQIQEVNTIELAGDITAINNIDAAAAFTVDYSIEGNGSNQYISLGNQQSTVLNPTEAQINANGYTFSSWVYIDDLTTSFQIFSLGVSGTNSYYGIQMLVNRNAAFVFHFFGLNGSSPGGGSNNRLTKGAVNGTISTGVWQHLAWVIPANSYDVVANWKIYINGSEYTGSTFNSGNSNVNLAYSGNSNIGVWTRAGSSLSNIFDGEINNAAIWNTALNSTNMSAIYNSGSPIDLSVNTGGYSVSSNLQFWMRFNEGTGTSYDDSSPNSFNGTGVNTPTWSTNVP
jgi:hypothetical protein